MMRGAAKAQAEGVDAYARVLLDWFEHEKYFVSTPGRDEDVSVEGLLLEVLKVVSYSELRRRIEQALVAKQRRRLEKKGTS